MIEYLVSVDLPLCSIDIPQLYLAETTIIVRSSQRGGYFNMWPEYLKWTLKNNTVCFTDDETIAELVLPSQPVPVGIRQSEDEMDCLDILRNDGTVQIVSFKEERIPDEASNRYTSEYTVEDYGLVVIKNMELYVRWFLYLE